MRLLWFSHFVPFPPQGGHLQRSFNLIRQMAKSHQISLVAFNIEHEPDAQLRQHARELEAYCKEVEIWDLPLKWRGARWWAKLALSPFHKLPYSCRAFWSPGLDARWRRKLAAHPGALVHFDSSDLALYAASAKGFRKVLNHHNCESAMARRRAEKELNPLKRAYLRREARKLERLERDVCPQFDVNTVVSGEDARLLLASSPGARVQVVENGTDIHYFQPNPGSEEPGSVIFAGGLWWYPNLSAIQYFVQQIWPRVKAGRAGARLYLAGRRPVGAVLHLADADPSIEVVANPEDMRPWMARAAVFICPILDGGGTRLKILDALAMGKAVVTTTLGYEGLRVRPGEHLLAADTAEDFAAAVLRLMEGAELRRQLGRAGRTLVEQEYSWERVGEQLERAYQEALAGPGATPRPR